MALSLCLLMPAVFSTLLASVKSVKCREKLMRRYRYRNMDMGEVISNNWPISTSQCMGNFYFFFRCWCLREVL